MRFSFKQGLNPRNIYLIFDFNFTYNYKLVFYKESVLEHDFIKDLLCLDCVDKLSFLNNSVILSKNKKSLNWDKKRIESLVNKNLANLDLKLFDKEEKFNNATLDLTGVLCPFAYIKLKYCLKSIDKGQEVKVFLSSENSFSNIALSLKEEGFLLKDKKMLKKNVYFISFVL